MLAVIKAERKIELLFVLIFQLVQQSLHLVEVHEIAAKHKALPFTDNNLRFSAAVDRGHGYMVNVFRQFSIRVKSEDVWRQKRDSAGVRFHEFIQRLVFLRRLLFLFQSEHVEQLILGKKVRSFLQILLSQTLKNPRSAKVLAIFLNQFLDQLPTVFPDKLLLIDACL
jgi:hypothetical protein